MTGSWSGTDCPADRNSKEGELSPPPLKFLTTRRPKEDQLLKPQDLDSDIDTSNRTDENQHRGILI